MDAPTDEVWKALALAYRLCGTPDHGSVAVQVGVATRVAKRSWEKGWPRAGMLPIRDTMEKERVKAMALRRRHEMKVLENRLSEAEAASDDAALTRALNAIAIRQAQGMAAGILQEVVGLLDHWSPLVVKIKEDIQKTLDDEKTKPEERRAAAGYLLNVGERALSLVERTMKLEAENTGDRPPQRPDADGSIDLLLHRFISIRHALPDKSKSVEVIDAVTAEAADEVKRS